jgi:hypothetical protein
LRTLIHMTEEIETLNSEDLKVLTEMIVYSTRHNSMYGDHLISKIKNMMEIEERLREFKAFECNPAYSWSAKYVYDKICEILGEPQIGRPLELDEIKGVSS